MYNTYDKGSLSQFLQKEWWLFHLPPYHPLFETVGNFAPSKPFTGITFFYFPNYEKGVFKKCSVRKGYILHYM